MRQGPRAAVALTVALLIIVTIVFAVAFVVTSTTESTSSLAIDAQTYATELATGCLRAIVQSRDYYLIGFVKGSGDRRIQRIW